MNLIVAIMKRLLEHDWITVQERNQRPLLQAHWNVLAYAFPIELRPSFSSLVATQPKGLKNWRQNPVRIENILQRLTSDIDLGLAGEILNGASADILLAVLAIDPSLSKIIEWWGKTGQHISCQIDGDFLLTSGFPRGPRIGLALQKARQEAWRGGDLQSQLLAAQQIWSPKGL